MIRTITLLVLALPVILLADFSRLDPDVDLNRPDAQAWPCLRIRPTCTPSTPTNAAIARGSGPVGSPAPVQRGASAASQAVPKVRTAQLTQPGQPRHTAPPLSPDVVEDVDTEPARAKTKARPIILWKLDSFDADSSAQAFRRNLGWNLKSDNIDGMRREVERHGGTIVTGPTDVGSVRVCIFKNRAGTPFAVVQPLDR